MNRFKVFCISFGFGVLLTLISGAIGMLSLVEPFVLILFVANIIYFLFKFEEPPKKSKLSIISVYKHHKSTTNNLNNGFALIFAFAAFIIFTLTTFSSFSLVSGILLAWLISIPSLVVYATVNSRNEIDDFIDYIKLNKPEIDLQKVRDLLKQQNSNKLDTFEKDITDLYSKYIDESSTLLQGEIEEINKVK